MLSHSGSRAVAAPTNDAQLFAQVRTSRIIQFSGLTCSTGSIDLTARASDILPHTDFHPISRAEARATRTPRR